ncbi:hypothetical protein ACHAXN_012407 [Cyclotella atomus]
MMAMKQLALAITSLATVTLYHAGSANALLVGPPCQNLSFRFWPSLATHRDVQRQLPHVACKTVRFSAVPSDEAESSTATTKTLSTLTSTTEVHVPLSLTLATGIVSTLLGFVYSRCMKSGFKLFWKTIPSNILNSSSKNYFFKFIQTYPAMYIVLMTTCGGAVVSYLSSKLPNLYSAHDYVHILSKDDEMTVNGSDEKDVFPSATSILPVMGLCLLTSLSGFSLGPEAPMVTVGSLAGASLARKYHKLQTSRESKSTMPSKSTLERTLAYAGAAGSLTGFMKIPLAGPIFALEMTSRNCGVADSALKSWTTSIISSFVGISFVRGVMMPSVGIGGHFDYISRAAVGAVSGIEMVAIGLGCGIGGAVVGTCFHSAVRNLKQVIRSKKNAVTKASTTDKYSGIVKKVAVALVLGALSTQYPQTMFWGEGSLQCMIDGQCTPFVATHHGIPAVMMEWAKVNPNTPLTSWFAALQVGMAKFFAIALASAAKYPGGVIFPLLSNGAGISQSLLQGISNLVPGLQHSFAAPMVVMSFMAATLTSITRTPLATCLILAMTASSITPLSVLLPGVLLASYISVFASEKLSSKSFFDY